MPEVSKAEAELLSALQALANAQSALESYNNHADTDGTETYGHLAHMAVSVASYVLRLATAIEAELNG